MRTTLRGLLCLEATRAADKERRPDFDKAEYDKLVQFLHHWHEEEGYKNKERRWLLKY